jgi:hypothetical protein
MSEKKETDYDYCEYCNKEMKKDDDFVLVRKYPSGWQEWKASLYPYDWLPFRKSSLKDFGMIYHKSCFLESERVNVKPRP